MTACSSVRCETPSIFRGIFRNTKLSNTSYIPREIPEYRRRANPRAPSPPASRLPPARLPPPPTHKPPIRTAAVAETVGDT